MTNFMFYALIYCCLPVFADDQHSRYWIYFVDDDTLTVTELDGKCALLKNFLPCDIL